jgi:hypothetical protein
LLVGERKCWSWEVGEGQMIGMDEACDDGFSHGLEFDMVYTGSFMCCFKHRWI